MIPIRDTIPSQRVPVVNYIIIAVNLFVFYYELTLGPDLQEFFLRYGLVPLSFHSLHHETGLSWTERIAPLFTSMFLHGGWLHLLGNMLYLYIFGDNVEDRLGHFRYLCFYLLCGAGAAFAQMYANPLSPMPMVGASGAIAGVSGAYFLFFPFARVVTLVPLFFFFQVVEIPAVLFLFFWFLLQLFYGVATMSLGGQVIGGVAWWAHVGGFVAGMVFGVLLAGERRSRRW